MKGKEDLDVVDPLSMLDMEAEEQLEKQKPKKQVPSIKRKPKEKEVSSNKNAKCFFITGTDTGVGKTYVTLALGLLMQSKGYRVGVMKPVQCGGNDTKRLMNILKIKEDIHDINPYYSKEEISPHVAFKDRRRVITSDVLLEKYRKLRTKYDVLLVEGAGGLMVPLTENYLMADLARDLNCGVIVVSRLGLGTINHTLLTVFQARDFGLSVRGVIFNRANKGKEGVPEKTNPEIIKQIGKVPVLGCIPYLPRLIADEIVRACKNEINVDTLIHPKIKRKTTELRLADKKYVWHPFTQMRDWLASDPLIINRARGCFLRDTDGRKYLDGVSSLWVNVHGHNKPEMDRAIKKQINKLGHSTLLGLSNVPAIELAKKLVEITPEGLNKVFYSDNGSTSVEVAIKIAYQYWQNKGKKSKNSIAHFNNSYHGDTLGSVSVGGIDLFHRVYKNLTFKTMRIDFPDCYRVPKNKKYPDYVFQYLDRMESTFKKSSDKIAALVVEPLVQAAAGIIVWPQGVLKRISEICRKYNVFLILDEVATGFGRTGKMFACEHEKVSPDFLCLSKGLTGGYLPLAATLTTQRIFDGFVYDYKDQKTFFHGHTYTGNPICCSAALANIAIFENEKVLEQMQPKIQQMTLKLKKFTQLRQVGDIRQKGFMVGIELVKNRMRKNPYLFKEKIGVRVCEEARKRGVILRPLGNVIVLMPPLSITEKQLDGLLDVTFWAIQQVTEK